MFDLLNIELINSYTFFSSVHEMFSVATRECSAMSSRTFVKVFQFLSISGMFCTTLFIRAHLFHCVLWLIEVL